MPDPTPGYQLGLHKISTGGYVLVCGLDDETAARLRRAATLADRSDAYHAQRTLAIVLEEVRA